MNRDKLVARAIQDIEALNTAGYQAPDAPEIMLAPYDLRDEMATFMDKGIEDGLFFTHDKQVAMTIATIVTADEDEHTHSVSEDDLFARERRAFISLAKTEPTYERISTMLDKGTPVRN